jgi:hypothetical protein
MRESDECHVGKRTVTLIRIEPLEDEQTQKFYLAIYHPAEAEQPIVTTRARYKTAAAAESDLLAIIASQANQVD